MWSLILPLLQVLYIITSYCSEYPEVSTNLGKVIGKTVFYQNMPVYTFQSIPYAKPPTGNYRFRKPLPTDYRDEPLQATELPPGCIQYIANPFPLADDLPGKSEDCLYLNIWTTSISNFSSKKPVMFYLHGGGFTMGSSRLDYFDGRVLSALGDVVVVTINYRLGPMGFLYAGTESAPGNMALYDMLEALKWVNANIKYFGGDEGRLTMFGQSSGAIAINMMMTSSLAKKYFHQAILDSGTATTLDGEFNDKDFVNSQKLAKAVGCANDSVSLTDQPDAVVQCLRGVDAYELSKTLSKVSDSSRSVYPRYGDEILPHNARLSVTAGKFADINVLIGVNNNEGSHIITKSHKDVFGYFGHKYPQINKTFGETLIREDFDKFPNPNAVVEHYLDDLGENDYYIIRNRVQSATGDFKKICPAVYAAEAIAGRGNEVYFYFFQHRPSVTPWARYLGVVHFDETPFMFGYPLRYPENYTAAELQLSKYMVNVLTQFTKTGRPDPQQWPLYSKKKHYYLSLNTGAKNIGVGPHLKDCNFFRKYFGF